MKKVLRSLFTVEKLRLRGKATGQDCAPCGCQGWDRNLSLGIRSCALSLSKPQLLQLSNCARPVNAGGHLQKGCRVLWIHELIIVSNSVFGRYHLICILPRSIGQMICVLVEMNVHHPQLSALRLTAMLQTGAWCTDADPECCVHLWFAWHLSAKKHAT